MNVKINHRLGVEDIKFFNEFELTLKYDAVGSTFGFSAYFDPKNRTHAEIFCVSHFHEAIVEHNGELLVTGYMLSQVFNNKSEKQLAHIGGYSKPGTLEDCNIPPSIFPLQSDGLNIKQIAEKLIAPFKLKMVIDDEVKSDMNKVIKKTTAEPTQTIKDYLTELTTQKNIIMSHNEKGDLLFTKAKTNLKPILRWDGGVPITDLSLNFNGQEMFSDITVMKQSSTDGGNAGEYSIKNPYCPIVFRQKNVIQSSGDDISIKETAMNALAAQLKGITLTLTLDRWELDGKLIRPNNIVNIKSPENFIYNPTDFFIESVTFSGDEKKQTCVLTCVLPEVYNRKTPKNIFVDPHKNFPRF